MMAEGLILSMTLTTHIGWDNTKFNNVHPAIAYEQNGYSVGAFRNSLNHTSLFVSKINKFDDFSVQYGLASNYENRVVPMIVLRKSIAEHVNLMVSPSYNKTTGNPALVLGIEVSY